MPWLATVLATHKYLRNVYDHAAHVLVTDGTDPVRITFHVDRISSNALRMLLELTSESELQANMLPIDRLQRVSLLFAEVKTGLQFLGANLKQKY